MGTVTHCIWKMMFVKCVILHFFLCNLWNMPLLYYLRTSKLNGLSVLSRVCNMFWMQEFDMQFEWTVGIGVPIKCEIPGFHCYDDSFSFQLLKQNFLLTRCVFAHQFCFMLNANLVCSWAIWIPCEWMKVCVKFVLVIDENKERKVDKNWIVYVNQVEMTIWYLVYLYFKSCWNVPKCFY